MSSRWGCVCACVRVCMCVCVEASRSESSSGARCIRWPSARRAHLCRCRSSPPPRRSRRRGSCPSCPGARCRPSGAPASRSACASCRPTPPSCPPGPAGTARPRSAARGRAGGGEAGRGVGREARGQACWQPLAPGAGAELQATSRTAWPPHKLEPSAQRAAAARPSASQRRPAAARCTAAPGTRAPSGSRSHGAPRPRRWSRRSWPARRRRTPARGARCCRARSARAPGGRWAGSGVGGQEGRRGQAPSCAAHRWAAPARRGLGPPPRRP
jgi:hypothetical protein